MLLGVTGVYATDNEVGVGVKDMINALSLKVQQIEVDLGIVKQQAADANTAAQNAQEAAQIANITSTDAKTNAQEAQQQITALMQEVNTLKESVEAQKQEIDSLQNQIHSTMNQYEIIIYESGFGHVSGIPVTIEGLGTFTTDSNGVILVYVPAKNKTYNLSIGGGYVFDWPFLNTSDIGSGNIQHVDRAVRRPIIYK